MNCFQRDPRLLATVLMGRAPNMMVPDNVDLNDYEVKIQYLCDLEFLKAHPDHATPSCDKRKPNLYIG